MDAVPLVNEIFAKARAWDGTDTGRSSLPAPIHLPSGWERWASAGGVKSKVVVGSGVGRWFL